MRPVFQLVKRSTQSASETEKLAARLSYNFYPENVLRFAKLSQNAFTPTKGSLEAAGYDLYAAYDYEIPVGHSEHGSRNLVLIQGEVPVLCIVVTTPTVFYREFLLDLCYTTRKNRYPNFNSD